MRAITPRNLVGAMFFAGALFCAASATGQDWKPARNVDIVVASGAGGSSDRSARVVQKLLQANPAFPSVSVTNRPGGGGTVAWTFLTQHPGDPHYIATFSPTMLTNQILGIGKLGYQDFTPLSILLREYVIVTVSADSTISSGRALVERLRKDPTSVSFAFAAAPGNHNHVLIGMIMKAAGADPRKAKVVIQKSGGVGVTSMMGGHIDVLVGAPANVIPHIQAGKVRALGIGAPQRQPNALASVPTFREQGIDALFFSWRGFIGPKDLTAAQIAFWDQAFAKAVQGEEWKKDLEMNAWAEDFMGHAETRKHLDTEHQIMTKMLSDLGVLSK
jgi:putative tricarboxylic transport membrane protein